jgi:hypothetical protein
MEELKRYILTTALIGGPLVAALSAWLGKLWSARILQKERAGHERSLEALRSSLKADADAKITELTAEFGLFRDVAFGQHKAKVELYRQAIGPFIDLFVQGRWPGSQILITWPEFERKRLFLSADLALFASKEVFEAFDAMYALAARGVSQERDATPEEVDEAVILGARFLQAARADVGLSDSPLPQELLAPPLPRKGS